MDTLLLVEAQSKGAENKLEKQRSAGGHRPKVLNGPVKQAPTDENVR